MNRQEIRIQNETREIAKQAPSLVALSQQDGRVYVHLATAELAERFLRQAEQESLRFPDGTKPTSRHASTVMALNPDHTISYVGTIGHIAYGSGTDTVGGKPLIRVNYAVWDAVAKN